MKKHNIIFAAIILFLTAAVSLFGFSLFRVNQEYDPYRKAAEILLSSYDFSVAPAGEVWSNEADIDQARAFLHTDSERCNLEGAALDLSQVFPNDVAINSKYEDSVMRVYKFPISTSQGVEIEATILFVDDALAAAYLYISNPLAPSYLFDAGITDPPTSLWPLDIPKDILTDDLDAWALIFRL